MVRESTCNGETQEMWVFDLIEEGTLEEGMAASVFCLGIPVDGGAWRATYIVHVFDTTETEPIYAHPCIVTKGALSELGRLGPPLAISGRLLHPPGP